jgi:hypothetical protein
MRSLFTDRCFLGGVPGFFRATFRGRFKAWQFEQREKRAALLVREQWLRRQEKRFCKASGMLLHGRALDRSMGRDKLHEGKLQWGPIISSLWRSVILKMVMITLKQ